MEEKKLVPQPCCKGNYRIFKELEWPIERRVVTSYQLQLEFYFKNVNLRRDKYLQGLIDKHERGFVEIKELLEFKRIKQIAHRYKISHWMRVRCILKAIRQSPMFKLCRNEKMVKKKEDFKEPEDISDFPPDRSVYIELFNQYVEEFILIRAFKNFGSFSKINMPRYKDGRNKRFAFIAFVNADGQKAFLKEFNKFKGYLFFDIVTRAISYTEWVERNKQFKKLKDRNKIIRWSFLSKQGGPFIKFNMRDGYDNNSIRVIKATLLQFRLIFSYSGRYIKNSYVFHFEQEIHYEKLLRIHKKYDFLLSDIESISKLDEDEEEDYLTFLDKKTHQRKCKKLKKKKRKQEEKSRRIIKQAKEQNSMIIED